MTRTIAQAFLALPLDQIVDVALETAATLGAGHAAILVTQKRTGRQVLRDADIQSTESTATARFPLHLPAWTNLRRSFACGGPS